MKNKSKTLWPGLLLAALIPFTLAALQAQPAKPQDTPAPTPETALHEIGASNSPAAPNPAPAAAPAAPAAAVEPVPASNPEHEQSEKPRHHHKDEDDRVSVGGATYVGPNETVQGNAVAVMGPVTVDGTVEGEAVAVMGENTVNGTVHGNAVAVLGDLKLGPKARVDGNAVSVAGHVIKDPSAIVGGNVVEPAFGIGLPHNEAASSWWKHGLSLGRPLAIGPHLHLFWIATVLLVAFYLLLAVLFPGGVRKCADTLEKRPGITFLTGFLAFLGMPVLFILLCVTIVGIPVAFVVLPVSIIACTIFGKVAVYSLVGRSIAGRQAHPAVAAIIGIAIFIALFLIPILGLMLWFLVGFLGFACALTTLFTSNTPAPAPGTPPSGAPAAGTPPAGSTPASVAQMAAAPAAVTAAAMAAPVPGSVPPPIQAPPAESAPAAASAAVPVAPPPVAAISEAGHPRAGFWIRMLALLIDAILIGVIFHMPSLFLPAIAAYGAVLWRYRGATIGGIILGLKVVRADGKPMDWITAVVRALACFFSLIVIGLGFLWIAFDREKQGWHDKIAGTVVVRTPKGVSLV